MEGNRGPVNTAYDYSTYNPTQNYSNTYLKQQGNSQQYSRIEYDSYKPKAAYADPSTRTPARRTSPVASRRSVDYSNIKQQETKKAVQNQANSFQFSNRSPIPPQQDVNPNEYLSVNQQVNQMYESPDYDHSDPSKAEGDYSYNENDEIYYTIGDCTRNDTGNYDQNKADYEELNQIVEEGDYFSIIEDQYSTDEGDYYDSAYANAGNSGRQTVTGGDGTYGEPFNPAFYAGQEAYDYDPEEQYDPGYYSTSTPTPVTQYAQRYQNYARNVPENPNSASCPVLPNNVNRLQKKDIFKQVSRKINETVAELRNAGIEERRSPVRASNPNLDYIRRYDNNAPIVGPSKEKAFQPRLQRVNPEKPQSPQSNSDAIQRKMYLQQQEERMQHYRQLMERKKRQGQSPSPTYRTPTHQGAPQIQRRLMSPTRTTRSSSEQERMNPQGNYENENYANNQQNKKLVPSNETIHRKMMQQLESEGKMNSSAQQISDSAISHYPYRQQEQSSKEGRKTIDQQLSELKRKKMETQMTDSFVQLHAVSDQTVPECCRQVYDDFKKVVPQENSKYK